MKQILQKDWVLYAVLLVVAAGAYASNLPAPFKTLDDLVSIVENPLLRDWRNLPAIFTGSFFGQDSYYRPLVTLSFLAEFQVFGLNAFWFNAHNVLLHVLTGIGVFLCARLLVARNLAALAAVVFVIHPVQWEAVANIAGRAVILSTLAYVWAAWAAIRYVDTRRRKFAAAALMLCLCALLAKEGAVTFPLLVTGYVWFNRRTVKAPWFFLVGLWLILAAYFSWRSFLGIASVPGWPNLETAALGVLSFGRAFLTYLQLLVWPTDLYFDRVTPLFTAFNDPQLIGSWIVIGLLALTLWTNRSRLTSVQIWFGFWFLLNFVPVAQLVPISPTPGHISSAERFLYLPLAGGAVCLVALIHWLWQKTPRLRKFPTPLKQTLLVAALVFLWVTTVQQSIYAGNQIAMFRQSLAHNPNNSRVRNSLGLAYAHAGLLTEAQEEFRTVLGTDPTNVRAQISLAKSLFDSGKYFEGLAVYDAVENPGNFAAFIENNLRSSHAVLLQKYRAMLHQDPANARIYHSLGVVYSRMKDFPQALEQYTRALELDPGLIDAWFNLAATYAATGKTPEAIAAYERVADFPEGNADLKRQALQYLTALRAEK